jgi:hypothetical protein
MLSPKRIAFLASMAALANLLGLLKLSFGPITIHMLQLPIVLTALGVGAASGGIVGLVGAIVAAFTLPTPNPYIIPGNAILGFVTGLLYTRLKSLKTIPLLPQLLAVLGAFLLQVPYAYITDVYLAGMPSPVVQIIIVTLLIEDVICLLISHVILFRITLHEVL